TLTSASGSTFQFGSFTGTASDNTGTAYKSSTKAFVTATAHGLSTGAKVAISGATPAGFNTTSAATITVLNVDAFTYTLTAAQNAIATGTITYTGNAATETAAGHGFANGASVTIAGASPSAYNGTVTI